ncbi:MAG: hypothetical protein HOC20_02805 [Chloroflexi bacterium]|nr:hypothetical protein [Chloroflexota bacterium]
MRKHTLILIMTLFLFVSLGFGYAEDQADPDAPLPRKSYAAAMAISFFVPGGGTLYAGKTTQGGIELGCTALSVGLMVAAGPDESWEGIAGVSLFMLNWIVSMVDAPIAVGQYNREVSTAVLFAPAKQLAFTPPDRNFRIQLCSLRF